MYLRFSTLAAFSLVLFLNDLYSQTAAPQQTLEPVWYATIQVQVRDSNGHPVSGLESANFIVNEKGSPDPIVSVRTFEELTSAVPATQQEPPVQQPSPRPEPAQRPRTSTQTARPTTWILLILAPMSATGRNASITGIQKFLNQPRPADWSLALFDDAGQLVPFSNDVDALRSRLNTLEHHPSAPQFVDGPWLRLATRAIAELGVKPGRRAIVFASDFVFDVSEPIARNPQLLRVSPSLFIDSARAAQAPMYTLQASGPGVSAPFGDAASAELPQAMLPMTGEIVASQINSNLVGLGAAVSDFAWSAHETGGRSTRTMQEALEGIAEDAAGLYRITFRPHLFEADGSWHPVSVQVRSPRVHAQYASFYVSPTSENREQVPSAIRAALKSGASPNGLDAATRVWIFPAVDGMSTTIMAADLVWPPTDRPSAPHSKLQLYVQLINQNIGLPVGSWITEREWISSGRASPSIHWQRELPLYPGSYELRVFAFDPGARRIATRAVQFTADPAAGFGAVRVSHTLVASRCLSEDEREGRKNLLDPLLLNGCLLAPAASDILTAQSKPTILVRLYAADRKQDALILKKWKAFVRIGDQLPIPLNITRGAVRGFIVSGQLDLEKLALKPGTYQATIGFDIGEKEPVFARPSELTITP